jgi:hypothetical protein
MHSHHEHEPDSHDPIGKFVGVLAAVLAVALAIVTIASHRTHTAAIMHKSTANDTWSYYQSTRIKLHSAELGTNLLAALGAKSEASEKMAATYETQQKKYESQSDKLQDQAKEADELAEKAEHRAVRFDLGEGFLEIALVLSSLYFISHKKMFPALGISAGVIGSVISITGLFV